MKDTTIFARVMEEKNFLYEDGMSPLTSDDLISKKDMLEGLID